MKDGLWWLAVVFVILMLPIAWAYGQDKAMFREGQGYMPDVVRVTSKMPDKGRVCVEVPGGIDACRPIGELRKWIVQPTVR